MPDVRETVTEPAWVERMRRRGYTIRMGAGDLPSEPESAFTPPPRGRRRSIIRSAATIVRRLLSPRVPRASHGRHAPVP